MPRTLLEAVNEVLDDVSEVQVTSTTQTQASRKALRAVKQAAIQFSTEYNWSWLDAIVGYAGLAFSANEVTFSGYRSVKWVKWGSSTKGYLTIPFVALETYYSEALIPITGVNNRPKYAAICDEKILLNPYPNDAASRELILTCLVKDYAALPVFPTSDSSQFSEDDRFVDCWLCKARSNMHMLHSHDNKLVQFWEAIYIQRLRTLMSQERNLHQKVANMYGYS